MATPLKASPLSTPRKGKPARPVKTPQGGGGGHAVLWMVLALLVAMGGGGYYYYDMQQKAAAEQERVKAENAAKAAKRKAEAARLAAEKAERERAEAERQAAEKAERERREAEERARREAEAAKKGEEPEKTAEPEPEPEPAPEPVQPAEPTPEKGAYEQEVALVGAPSLEKAQMQIFEGMVERLLTEHDFADFAAAFKQKIPAAAQELIHGEKLNYNGYKVSRNLVRAVDITLMADLVPQDKLAALCSGNKEDAQSGRAYFEWLLRDKTQPLHELLRWFMLEEGRPDTLGYALQTFYEVWKVCPPRERSRYMNLAVACALVDPNIAHSQGRLKAPKAPMLTMPELFTYFREQDAKHKLLTDIKKMSVELLLYVVDVRLPQSEFDWVNKNLEYKRANWGDAYASIRYRMDRAANNVDPYKEYTFAELRKEGGVCRDQAYFCGTSSKCKGIPSVYAVGDGDRGPHAWTVLLVDDRTWVQINNYGYTTGTFPNTCSGRRMHESVFLSQTKNDRADKLAPAGDAMELSYLLARAEAVEEARGAARYITGAFPTLTAAWVNLVRVLETDEENHPVEAAAWRKVDSEMQIAARKNMEIMEVAGEVEDKHLSDGKTVGARKSAMDRQMRQMKRSSGDTRADLVVSTIEREAKVLAEAKNVRGLQLLYKKQLKDYTDRGDIFEQLIAQYMRYLEDAGAAPRDWKSIAKEVEKLYDKKIRSDGSDYFKLTKELSIQKQIGDMYEKAGDSKKAEKLKDDADTRLKDAKSQYKKE